MAQPQPISNALTLWAATVPPPVLKSTTSVLDVEKLASAETNAARPRLTKISTIGRSMSMRTSSVSPCSTARVAFVGGGATGGAVHGGLPEAEQAEQQQASGPQARARRLALDDVYTVSDSKETVCPRERVHGKSAGKEVGLRARCKDWC